LRERHGGNLLLIEARALENGAEHILIVLDGDSAVLATERAHLSARSDAASLPVEVIGRDMWETMQRLAASGLVAFTAHKAAPFIAQKRRCNPPSRQLVQKPFRSNLRPRKGKDAGMRASMVP